MALNIKEPPKRSVKEIILPSSGYPYNGKIPGGRLLIQAFDWESERILFKAFETEGSKETLRYIETIKRVSKFPEGFDPETLLEGDLQYILMECRSLSYGETYSFQSKCPYCDYNEEVELKIPLFLPTNRYPSDFGGTLKIKTSNDNGVEIRFITIKQDMECENAARNKIAKKMIRKEDYDAEYSNSRVAYHIVSVNGGKPDSIDEVRNWLTQIPISERKEIIEFINRVSPGVSFNILITCEECGKDYERMLPIGADFFRARRRNNEEQLPRGVRIGVLGQTELSEFDPSPRAEVPNTNSGSSSGRKK